WPLRRPEQSRSIIRVYFLHWSTQTTRRPNGIAAAAVVPVPANGSSTVSPCQLNSLMSRCGISTGNTAGCSSWVTLAMCHTVFVYSLHSSLVSLLLSLIVCEIVLLIEPHPYPRTAP